MSRVLFESFKTQNLRHCKQDREPPRVFWQEPRLGTSQPNVAACEGLCEAFTEGAASRDAGATAGRVRPVCPP